MKYKGKKELMELIGLKDLKKDLICNNIYNYLLINENPIYLLFLFFLITRSKSLKMINQKINLI